MCVTVCMTVYVFLICSEERRGERESNKECGGGTKEEQMEYECMKESIREGGSG